MKRPRRIAKLVILGSAIALLCRPALASDKAKDDAKTYQAELQAMKGQQYPEVEKKLRDWKFELRNNWQVENPTAENIAMYNQGATKFSKKEIRDIFGSTGKFKVEIFGKRVATTSATVGTITDVGVTAGRDMTVNLETYTVIRVVFKDDALIDVRTWPKMDRSTYLGGVKQIPVIR